MRKEAAMSSLYEEARNTWHWAIKLSKPEEAKP